MVFYVFLVQTTAKDTFSSMHLSLGRYWPPGKWLQKKKKKIVTGEFLFIMQQKLCGLLETPGTLGREAVLSFLFFG